MTLFYYELRDKSALHCMEDNIVVWETINVHKLCAMQCNDAMSLFICKSNDRVYLFVGRVVGEIYHIVVHNKLRLVD